MQVGYRCRSIVPENLPCLRPAEGPIEADPHGVINVDSVIFPKVHTKRIALVQRNACQLFVSGEGTFCQCGSNG